MTSRPALLFRGWRAAGAVVGLVVALLAAAAGAVTLKAYTIVGDTIPEPLGWRPGDAEKGRFIALDMDLGNCLACHSIPIPEEPFHGTIGPNLRGIGARMTAGQLRLRIVDPKRLKPDTPMPAYYRVDGLTRVRADRLGKPILDGQEIEDLIAFLLTMTR
jgi:L-cysteine S-thiosulfotransferase